MSTTIKLVNEKVQVFTDYGELDLCKSIVGGKWNKTSKCWEYPIEAVSEILNKFSGRVDAELIELEKRHRHNKLTVRGLKEGKIKTRDHKFLMEHQKICRDIAMLADRYAFFLDTGTGKTITALSIIEENLNVKWIILCPKSIIKTAWCDDKNQWFPDIKLLPISRNMSKKDFEEMAKDWGVTLSGRITVDRLKQALAGVAQAIIVNPECFKADYEFISKLGIRGFVMDESSMIKNNKSQLTKKITDFSDDMNKLYLLSGKPAPNTEVEYFPQIRIVNQAIFGNSFTRFKERYFDAVGFGGYELRLKPGADKAIADKLSECSIVIKKDDCLDLPDKVYLKRIIELPAEARKYYKQMEKEQVLMLSDKNIEAAHKMAARMKLRQITSGFIIDTENATTDLLHNAKINELEDVVAELGDNKAIIWINFKQEVREISKLLDRLGKTFTTAYSGTNDLDASITEFKDDTAQFIIAHPKTLKYGVTFTGRSMKHNCTYAIYFSMSDSYEDYYQSHDRIYRNGQTESCTYIFLMVENSVDVDMSINVDDKHNRTEVIENFMRRASDGSIQETAEENE
jgi:SNF2 family DNA or RNA helicase